MSSRRRGTFVILLAAASCSRVYVGHPPVGSAPLVEPEAIVYVLGDMGVDNDSFKSVVRSLKKDVENDPIRPTLLAVGDNLYESGLPTPDEWRSSSGKKAVLRLTAIAALLGVVTHEGRPVPVVFIPGNHDYDGSALKRQRRMGDITRWYFLDELEIPNGAAFEMMPGDPDSVGARSSAELYKHLYDSDSGATALAEFMKPEVVSLGNGAATLVAIDSELLIELYGSDRALARQYLSELERLLLEHRESWTLVLAHHPLETGGAHRPGLPLRFLLGPGWPQYPALWHKLLIWAGPPITVGRWMLHLRQDIHNGAYERYRAELYDVLRLGEGDLLIAGHDHNTQLIELTKARGVDGPPIFQLLSGEVAKLDPVAKQRGTLSYHADGGYVRVLLSRDRIRLELKNRFGEVIDAFSIGNRRDNGRLRK